MKTTSDIKKKIAKLEEELAKMRAIELLDMDIPEPTRVLVGGPLAEYTFTYEVNTLDQAQQIISSIWNSKSVDVLPLHINRSNVTTRFITSYHENHAGVYTNVFPVVVNVDKWHLEFVFYGFADSSLVRFCVRFDNGFSGYACVRYTQKQEWHKVKGAHLEHSAFRKPLYITWASGSPKTPPSYTMYWTEIKSLDEMFEV